MLDESLDIDRRWARRGGAYLLIAFLVPLVVGPNWLFFPTLLDGTPPAAKVLVLAPVILGVVALGLTFVGDGLQRAAGLLLATGLTLILLQATIEAMTAAAMKGAPPGMGGAMLEALPRSAALILTWQAAMVLGFVGTAFALIRPESTLGVRVAGVAGAVLLALHFVPGGGGMAVGMLVKGEMWQNAWFVPVSILASLAFAGTCLGQLFGLYDPDDLARLTLWLGGATLLIGPAGLVLSSMSNAIMATGTLLSVLVKLYGTLVALHILMAAGVLGLLLHGLAPAPQEG